MITPPSQGASQDVRHTHQRFPHATEKIQLPFIVNLPLLFFHNERTFLFGTQKELAQVLIKRCFKELQVRSKELHMFGDHALQGG